MSAPVEQQLVRPWQPDMDAAVKAVAARTFLIPEDVSKWPKIYERLTLDVRAALDASGALAEIERLRAIQHASLAVMETLRAENRAQCDLLLTLLLDPILSSPPGEDELAAAAEADGFPADRTPEAS